MGCFGEEIEDDDGAITQVGKTVSQEEKKRRRIDEEERRREEEKEKTRGRRNS